VTLAPDVLARDRDGPPDETRQARERRDRRRDPTSDLESDWVGEMILGQYLYGHGRPVDLYDDPAWTRYWGAQCTVWFPEEAPAVLTGYPADEIPAAP